MMFAIAAGESAPPMRAPWFQSASVGTATAPLAGRVFALLCSAIFARFSTSTRRRRGAGIVGVPTVVAPFEVIPITWRGASGA